MRITRHQFLKTAVAAPLGAVTVSGLGLTASCAGPHARPGDSGSRPERVLLMGIAAARLKVIRELAARGMMPVFERLLREGAMATDCSNTNVSKTHPGWITIASGASTGTHRVHHWRFSDDGLSGFRMSLLGARRQAEYLWEAAERQEKKVIVLAWPDSWPSRLTRGLQVGGACLGPNATFFEGPVEPSNGGPVHRFAVGADEYFSTAPAAGMSPMILEPLETAGIRPAGIDHGFAAKLPLRCYHADRPLRSRPIFWLVTTVSGTGAQLYADGKWNAPIVQLEPGQWTDRIEMDIETENGSLRAVCRMKLLTLDCAAQSSSLYVTPICALNDGRMQPANGAPELARLHTLAIPSPVFLGEYCAQLLDLDSQRELLEMSNRWYVEAALALLQRPFDLFAMMTNNIDWAQHAMWGPYRSGVSQADCVRFLEACYADLDRMVGDILAAAPAGTAICLVSEHGVIDPWDTMPAPWPKQVLQNAGLLVYDKDGRVDQSKTKAFYEEDLVHVLPKNPVTDADRTLREERIRETIRVLSSARIPGTNECLFTVVLRWEDAGPFGFHGAPMGDIVAYRPAACGNLHADSWPLDAGGRSSLKPMILLWGPGVQPGAVEERPTRLEDIAPTLALLLGIRPPEQCEGRPLWRLLNSNIG